MAHACEGERQGAVHAPYIPDDLDSGIARYVEALIRAGIETFESCDGSDGHAFPEPTVCFHGDRSEGFRALAVVTQLGFPVRALRRYWDVNDAGEPEGPRWELAFWPASRGGCTRGNGAGHRCRAFDALA
jgi:hypothetical protein